jgi:hypothetical protein
MIARSPDFDKSRLAMSGDSQTAILAPFTLTAMSPAWVEARHPVLDRAQAGQQAGRVTGV